MANHYTEVTSQGYFSRLGGSIKGVIGGFVMIALSCLLLFWNEGRAIKTARSLEEGAGAVVEAKPDAVDAANDRKEIHFTGDARTSETLSDPKFGVSAPAIHLRRKAEMYQWKETKRERSVERVGGRRETEVSYDYDTGWDASAIDSSEFRHPEDHRNPAMPFRSELFSAREVMVGAYRLSSGLVGQMDAFEALPVSDTAGVEAPPGVRVRSLDGGLYLGNDPAKPAVGDLRVSFQVVKPALVSIVAMQNGSTLAPYATHEGGTIELLRMGSVGAAQIFKEEQDKNATLTWILRGLGFFVMFLGFYALFRPLVMVVNVLPFLGDL
ncbi:MAG TPA: TMEM43 family protein, partial [Planctomycetota bacterium]|nr:TMEM43 family protein [Planctomycetota bacterium]